MAKKKTSRAKKTPDNVADNVKESASQIWLAGLGALSKAQEEGARFFENLVKDGLSIEKKTRKVTESRVNEVREAVEGTVDQVQKRASASWDKLEKVFEDRVAKALAGLGVPTSDDVKDLTERVAALQDAVEGLTGKPARKKTTRKKVTRKAASKKTTRKVAKKTAKKTAKKKTLRKAASKKASSRR